ncbi:histidinol dehydrogenase [Anaeromyxobacter paludicola]|uniref:Histidinol dehydrogenase n=1 Tax=Anaeromyxobacter paludicola TaxID=2918171 RepID=A0ABN6N6Z0_9BACT|nr:histidinol dehydrogenase [Anaeromyxobacter paludicola]BDG08936.1 histidinol dehydrogenase [Anaeromyxobacter paludicola]
MQIFRTRDPDFQERWTRLCARGSDEDEAPVREAAARIVDDVRKRGDAALLEYTARYDGFAPSSAADLALGPADFARAFHGLPAAARKALKLAADRVAAFHRRESDALVPSRRDAIGATLGQESRPLARVGLYVPGGTARYPSTVLHTAVPAKVAGVAEVVACSPAAKPGPDGQGGQVDAWTLAACHVAGVSRLFRMGGAQAVAALAYGTATVPAVDKICGPGNAYVAAAKRLVYGKVDIDMIAGPSEILVVADGAAAPQEVAADLLAQAEHDVRAVSVLVTSSERLARQALAEVDRQLAVLPRQEIASRSIHERGAVVVARNVAEAVRLADEFAPEHLALLLRDAPRWVKRLSRAGAVFCGTSTPEAVGDYLAGPSHVLPTAGTARFASPLSVATFRRRMSVLAFTPKALAEVAPSLDALAMAEGLEGHARAVRVRLALAAERAGAPRPRKTLAREVAAAGAAPRRASPKVAAKAPARQATSRVAAKAPARKPARKAAGSRR